ncbi:hypothetical protein HpBGD95_15340 [Helicobacter pylori]
MFFLQILRFRRKGKVKIERTPKQKKKKQNKQKKKTKKKNTKKM